MSQAHFESRDFAETETANALRLSLALGTKMASAVPFPLKVKVLKCAEACMSEGPKSAANHWYHLPLQAIAAVFCAYWWFRLPDPGRALLVLGGVVALMMLYEMRPAHKAVYILLVIALLLIENRAINQDHYNLVAKENAQRKDQNDRFQQIADGLNTTIQQSQAQFAVTMNGINQDISTATGGDSFCYMIFSAGELGAVNAIPTFVQVGKYPLSDLDARIVNLDDYNKAFQENIGLEQALNAAGTKVTLGNLSGGTALINPQWKIPLSDNLNYRIFFNAKNGFWMEDFEVRRVNGSRIEALRVRRQNGNKTPTIFQKIDKGFPRVRGTIEWPK